MENIFDHPTVELWQIRRDWLDTEIENAQTGLVYDVSDHATALFMDMQIAFCSGAWLCVIIVAVSVIDAHLRECEAVNNKMGTANLLSEYFQGEDVNWLRKLRNRYVHMNADTPAFRMNDWFTKKDDFEGDARKAVKMAISALFQNPGI